MSDASHDLCIAFYSHSGHSKRLAFKLAEELYADVIEIKAPRYEGKILGYIRAGYDSLCQKAAVELQVVPSMKDYQHAILVGPIWTSYPAAPLRTLMQRGSDLPQAVSLFLTCGAHSPPQKAFATGMSDLGRPFVATVALPNSLEGTVEEGNAIRALLPELKEPAALIEAT